MEIVLNNKFINWWLGLIKDKLKMFKKISVVVIEMIVIVLKEVFWEIEWLNIWILFLCWRKLIMLSKIIIKVFILILFVVFIELFLMNISNMVMRVEVFFICVKLRLLKFDEWGMVVWNYVFKVWLFKFIGVKVRGLFDLIVYKRIKVIRFKFVMVDKISLLLVFKFF